MITIFKNKNFCDLFCKDEKIFLQINKIFLEKFSVTNKNYIFIERNFYYQKNQLKKLFEEKKIVINYLQEIKKKPNENNFQYEYKKNKEDLEQLQKQIENFERKVNNLEKFLKFSEPIVNFYKVKTKDTATFENGFLPEIKKILKENSIAFEIESIFKYPRIKANRKNFNRRYQYLAIKKFLKNKQGIIKLPTGSGKTEIAHSFIQTIFPYVLKRKKRILFIVEQTDLILQTKDSFSFPFLKIKPRISLLGGGFKDIEGNVVISTVQTLSSLKRKEPEGFKEWAKTFDAFIVDECDLFTTDKRIKVLRSFINAKWKLFLSATPFSRFKDLERMKMIGVSGGIIFTVEEKELVGENYLSEQEAIFIKSYTPENDKKFFGRNKWLAIYKQLIVEGKYRNKLLFEIFKVLQKYNLKSLFIVEHKEHGYILNKLFNVPYYLGKDDIYERKKAINGIQTNKEPIIITTRIFRRAINIPELQVYINCAGMKSDNIVLQGKGRIGRIKKTSENKALYIDVFDYGNTILEEHSLERQKTLETLIKVHNIYIEDLEKRIKEFFGKV